MTTELSSREKSRSRWWVWLVALVGAGGFVAIVSLPIVMMLMTGSIEKSPGYALAKHTLISHGGVQKVLGAPVRVTGTKARHITKTLTKTSLALTFTLEGPTGDALAKVEASESGGPWVVERATIECARGAFGLLPDGGLQPLYQPQRALASSGP